MSFWSVAWDVLDDSGSPVGRLNSSGGSLTWDGTARIQRVVRGVQFDASDWQAINPFRDRLKLLWVEDNGDTTPLGVFHVAQLPKKYIDENFFGNPEPYLVDGGFFLDQPSVQGLSGRLGERLSDVMARLCDQAGVGSRVISPCGEFCGEPILTPSGTSYSQSLTGIARLANFLPPHFDRNGVLRLVPPPPLTSAPAAVYGPADVVRESRLANDNLLDAPNVFVVIGSGASKSEIIAEVEIPSSAPHSVANRGGRRVVSVRKEQGVDSFAQAQRIASQMALVQVADLETVAFDTLPNPLHDCYEIIELHGENYREKSWTLPLRADGTAMKHSVNRANPVEGRTNTSRGLS